MRNLFKYYLVLILILGSCAVPAPVIKLIPSTLQNKDYWNLGQQFVFSFNNNIWVDCGFNRVENDQIVYDVKFTNQSDTAVLIDPCMFSQVVFANDSLKIGWNYAYDPEQYLTHLKLEQNTAEADARNSATLGMCAALLSVGASTVVVVAERDNVKKAQMLNTIGETNNLIQVSSSVANEDANIRAESNWTQHRDLSEMFLRKTTLPKGYYLDGEVRFPYYLKAKWYNVYFLVNNTKVEFLFQQKLTYPTPTPSPVY